MLQPRLTAVQAMHSLTLRLEYETGEVKLFDVAPYATGSLVWAVEGSVTYFSTVRLLPNGAGIEWPEGQDIAPHELYEDSHHA